MGALRLNASFTRNCFTVLPTSILFAEKWLRMNARRNLICTVGVLAGLLGAAFSAPARASEAAEPQSTDSFLVIDPLNISVIQKLSIRGILQVVISLDIPDKKLRQKATALYPRLQDSYVQSLRFYSANRLNIKNIPNVNEIARTLQATTNSVLREKGATVLLSQVMVQRPN